MEGWCHTAGDRESQEFTCFLPIYSFLCMFIPVHSSGLQNKSLQAQARSSAPSLFLFSFFFFASRMRYAHTSGRPGLVTQDFWACKHMGPLLQSQMMQGGTGQTVYKAVASAASPPVRRIPIPRGGWGKFQGPQRYWWNHETSCGYRIPGPPRPSCLSLNKSPLEAQTCAAVSLPLGEAA